MTTASTLATKDRIVVPTTLSSTVWIPRAVRCGQCAELAREQVRERLDDEEIVVRYGCAACRWHQTRHYHQSEIEEGVSGAE